MTSAQLSVQARLPEVARPAGGCMNAGRTRGSHATMITNAASFSGVVGSAIRALWDGAPYWPARDAGATSSTT